VKLRIGEDSLRLRLSDEDVAALVERGGVEQQISFGPDGRLAYAIEIGETGGGELGVRYRPGRITVLASAERARSWARSDEVGLEQWVRRGAESLHLLVEKDFPCQHDGVGESGDES